MGLHIAIIWQRYLPYHWARVRHAHERLTSLGYRITAVEVASQDASYSFPEDRSTSVLEHICCFPSVSYHDQRARKIYEKVLQVLTDLNPDVVFCPATAFPEGMAALAYRLKHGKRVVMMDDAWEHTDRRGPFTRLVKRIIHKNIEAIFVPAPSHVSYFHGLRFPEDRMIFGVDVVDNEYFSARADRARQNETAIRQTRRLPEKYFLFVGRFLPRKGLDTLLLAYRRYRERAVGEPWALVLVGRGSYEGKLQEFLQNLDGVQLAGAQFGDDLCVYYALANAFIAPSESDPWGLVVNEAMASGAPVLVSRGCGCAGSLVREAENGWTFAPGDTQALSALMFRMSLLAPETIEKMGRRSKELIDNWSLDRFTDGIISALDIPRRPPAGIVADFLTNYWKGRVRPT
jgi:glycosyltransferase involved in cell wall biosynthesis